MVGITKLPVLLHSLPTVFTDDLSYYEQLGKVVTAVNDIVNFLGNQEETFLQQAMEYTNNAIDNAKVEIDVKITEFTKLSEKLQKEYTEFVRITNAKIALLESRIADFAQEIDDSIAGVNERTDLAITQNNEQLMKDLSKGLVDIKVTNYFTGQKTSVQNMFNYLASLHVVDGMTYSSLVAKALTYTAYAGKKLTYTQLAMNGSSLL